MKILVVEDDSITLDFLAKKLREHGYAVDTSENGEDGLFKAQSWDYDAIILDVMMPGLTGWEVLRSLRKVRKTPVLMLTARDATDDKVSSLDSGADDHLVKPFELPELFARLRALIRRTADQAHPVITIGEISINLTSRIVTRASERLALSPREYAITEHLALHRGNIVTRSALHAHVFDENDDTLSNVIDVHIGKIRKKLGKEFIVTHHGHGYCIEG
ncbi:response regulator transcription factor [Verrucomicrobia bacterium]|jgi:two-component system, OmpR family, response regulator|nr:response regulator transcription factor [Verrucomicrobiota bacterium]MDB4798882.1 response regulator transcription factor [Verrucomicrobiota bacterium]